ncbi:MAG: hypothetical protein ACJ8AD_19335 [Gemmatimonadaceae bacterium]
MRCRRLFALLTSAAMLHLSVAGNAACAPGDLQEHHAMTPGSETVAERAMRTDGHVMPAPEANEPATLSAGRVGKADLPPCETPVQQHCCDAVVGCGVIGAVTSHQHLLAPRVLSAPRIEEALHDAPASFVPAPEPPPPKA